jgi:predicted outer membrane repeat protein
MAVTATAAAGLVLTGLAPAQAASSLTAAVTDVPCSVPALVSAVSGAASGETLSLASYCLYRLTAGLPVISQTLTIDGNNATLKRSTAKAIGPFVILRANGGGLTINALNFRNGDNAITLTGEAALTLTGGKFIGNSGTDGGAIYDFTGGDGTVVTGAQFIANTASGSGGAIYDNAAMYGAQITDCTFTRNQAGADGGGVYDFSQANDSATGSRFFANRAAAGGGGWFSTDATILSHVVARGNVATGQGGGLWVADNFTVQDSVIQGNQAGTNGGGLYDEGSERQEQVLGTTVRGNTAADGGGIYADNAGVLTLTGDRIAGNDASSYGGGVFVTGTPGDGVATVTSTRIVRNVAATGGGGIYNQSQVAFTLTTSEVSDNEPDNCEPLGSITGCVG